MAVIAVAVMALVVLFVVSGLGVFSITGIDAPATDHLSSETIVKLAKVPEGSTLLNVDTATITANLQKNPWVDTVSFKREFPNTLGVEVEERTVKAVVVMGTGDKAWLLGDGNIWLEPLSVQAGSGQTLLATATAKAKELGCLLVTGVPLTASPVAGSAATDDVIVAVFSYLDQFSSTFSAQIVSFSAASTESISCTLSSGVEISLGAPSNVSAKESAATELLAEYPNQITYINVRVPSKPTYRRTTVNVISTTAATTTG